jgi:hypothetical protein
MDDAIRRLAAHQLDIIDEKLTEKEASLEYDDLKKVGWAAELANDFNTMHHIADLM